MLFIRKADHWLGRSGERSKERKGKQDLRMEWTKATLTRDLSGSLNIMKTVL